MPIQLLVMDEAFMQTVADRATFEARYACTCGPVYPMLVDVVQQTQAFHRAVPRHAPWGSYVAVDPDQHTVIGTCAFVAAPDATGQVEIAYYTFASYEGLGYGTAMAAALIAIARAEPAVRTILAHTLPEPNASTRILTKVGMQRAGEAVDADAGPVWRWAYALPDPPLPVSF